MGCGLLLIGLGGLQPNITAAEFGLAMTGLGLGVGSGPLSAMAVGNVAAARGRHGGRAHQRGPHRGRDDRGCDAGACYAAARRRSAWAVVVDDRGQPRSVRRRRHRLDSDTTAAAAGRI